MPSRSVILDEGKYRYVYQEEDGRSSCLRHGQPWLETGELRKSETMLVTALLDLYDELESAKSVLEAIRSQRASLWVTDEITTHDKRFPEGRDKTPMKVE